MKLITSDLKWTVNIEQLKQEKVCPSIILSQWIKIVKMRYQFTMTVLKFIC